jgi:DNA-binding transcriptional MerR regulator
VSYSVGEVARLAGVTVRTLHHYDEVGLLAPSGRSDAGYRRYERDDLERLQRILFYRELELPLDEIAELLRSETDPVVHLRRQRDELVGRIERLQQLVTTLETTMEARKLGIELTPEEMLEVFGDHDPLEYADEVEERWGDTDAYRQSVERSKRYSKDDWSTIMAEAEAIGSGFGEALRSGEPADGERAMDLAEQHRQHISRWFYDCSYEMQRGLAEMYVADQRFADTYEQIEPGLAAYVREAVLANADRAEGDGS